MNVPYNTGKVQIGINYQPKPYIENDPDMIYIQGLLLGRQSKKGRRMSVAYLATLIGLSLYMILR